MEKTVFDYVPLKILIKEEYGKYESFAKELGMSRSSLSQRLNNRVKFEPEEMHKIKELLDIPDDKVVVYFFKPKVQKTEQAKNKHKA